MSTKLGVQTEALYAYRDGSQRVAEHLEQLSSLLEQARVSDDCFGPLGEFLAFSYFNSLEECQNTATKAGRFMEKTGKAVGECAQNYTDTDGSEADKIAKLDLSAMRADGSGPGGLSEVNSAGADQARTEMEQIANYGSSWASASQSLARASDPPSVAIATVNMRSEQLNALTSPGQAFVDNGLGFLISIVISPLVELILEPAVGDPAQMRSTGKGWAEVADWVDRLAEHEGERARATEPVWEGQAADAFRKQMDEFVSGAKAMATDVRGLKEALDLAADLFDAFVEMCIDIIQELVIGLIVEWLAALAASWITAGASVGAASGMTTAQVAITGTRLGSKVANLLHKLKPIVTKLEDLLQSLRKGPLRKVVDNMDDLRNGNKIEQWVSRKIDSKPVGKILTHGDTTEIRKAERALEETREAAARGEKTAADVAAAQRRLDEANIPSTTGNRFAKQASLDDEGTVIAQTDRNGNPKTSWSGDLHPELEKAREERAVAANLAQAGLNTVGLNGEARWQDAILHQGTSAVVNEGVEQGIKQGYDETTERSDEQRQAAQERGFD
ncbi:hypothetical protein SAMN04487905_107154 [Actinopolyspora xinjiangensis]|uniref:WXG100 family type VII secretion target n=1 Tax=Actinopolyspora xinjiangensis TaxID=405564 RepID=A0A1H0UU71_9ACTN|nr:hypothetical protein [Actinopolyspora xinjiangensis]SDP69734.1 hypothetical protein SAMN04487905_107154 [Actinopolyspora xinjiangensis]